MAIDTTHSNASAGLYATATPLVPDGKSGNGSGLFGSNGLGFDDIIDAVNPLQHLPGISTLYRNFTGDELSAASRMAGGAILGGPVGFLTSAVNSALEASTGKDVGEHVLALFSPQAESDAPTTLAATSQTAPQGTALKADEGEAFLIHLAQNSYAERETTNQVELETAAPVQVPEALNGHSYALSAIEQLRKANIYG